MPDPTLVVIADAHLGAAPPQTERDLIRFLAAMPDLGDLLLINGDLFDFWFSYRRVIPRHGLRVAAALARLREQVPIIMIGGNHDRWDDAFWRDDLGIDFAPDQRRFEAAGRQVLAVHGDGLTDPRFSARMLHWLIARRSFVASFRALHPDLAFRLVDKLAPHLGEQPVDAAVLAAAAERQRAWAEESLEQDR
ncbi:MAG TPA: metallophosphoesterase, partial [Gemmatimonadales bacterium]|nr:metallophosphoesterase [Gemmatimonadales bacterium]